MHDIPIGHGNHSAFLSSAELRRVFDEARQQFPELRTDTISESMTSGVAAMSAERKKYVRVQEKGQVTLPAEIRKRLGLKKDDLVAVVATADGVLITPQEVVATKALADIGNALQEQGLSLEEMIERGRAIRGQLFEEQYGSADADSGTA